MTAVDSAGENIEAVRAAVSGQYTIDRLLGQGGMGAVYLGRDKTLDRPVAIKVIKPDVAASDLIRDRFLQEARSVARLRHPNIVSVYSAGESNGLLWFAMELVEGKSLRELMESEGRLPHATAERILSEIALALDHAHANGLVHRDVKPDNILIETSTGRALLTDFGVARATQAGAEHGLTQTGMIIGSPRYMAPEQISGGTIDGRADLYALALVGYELFSGRPVVEAGTVASMIYKHMSETPPPLASAVPGIPPRVSATVARGLEKDPAKRFQTGAEFAQAIRDGEFSSAAHMNRELRRRTIMIAAAAVLVVAAFGAWIGLKGEKVSGNSFLVTPFEIQTGDQSVQWLRDGSVNMLTLTLGQWSDLNVVDYERTLSLIDAEKLGSKTRLSAEDAFALARRAGASRVVMGQVLTTSDSLIVIAKLYDVASKTSDQQAQASIARGADPRPLFDQLGQRLLDVQGFNGASTVQLAAATTSSLGAYRAYLDGVKLLNSWRLTEADREFGKAVHLDTTFALAYHKRALGLGWSQSGSADYQATSAKAFELSSRLPPRERSLVAGHHHLVLALSASGLDTAAAMREFDESIKAYRQLIDPPRGDSLVAEAWYGLADAYYHARVPGNSFALAEANLTKSLRGFKKTLAIDSTYHLAYSHLVQLYNQGAAGGSVIVNDSVILLDTAVAKRLGTPRIEALRADARQKGIVIAKAWTRADDKSSQSSFQLAQSFASAGQPESSVVVLRESLAKPRSGAALARLALLQFEDVTADSNAASTLEYVLDHFTPDSLHELSIGTRFQLEGQVMTSAAVRGRSADIDRAAKLYRASDPNLPFTSISSAAMVDYFRVAHRIAVGDSITPAIRKQLLGANLWMDSLPPQLYMAAKNGSVEVPYLAFLITHDTAYQHQAADWFTTQSSTGLPEFDAILALDRGDTAAAMAIAKTFPLPDSLRDSNFSLGGMRTVTRAEILERLGLTRQAAETYAAVTPLRVSRNGLVEPGIAIWVRSLVAQARLWAKLGERAKAIAAYEEFLRRWKDADGSAAQQVAQARSELARLRDAPAAR
jgi:tetratricopeptide (TPR) repeat protein/predicted Ser/Thr protein kinase